MRLLIDEDTAVQLVEPLRHVLLGHEVAHISDLSWKGKKDLRVLPDAKSAGYHVLITRDRAQFSDPRECDAIKKSGLHHVRYAQRQGARGLALALGAIIEFSSGPGWCLPGLASTPAAGTRTVCSGRRCGAW
jgi:PIN like domain